MIEQNVGSNPQELLDIFMQNGVSALLLAPSPGTGVAAVGCGAVQWET